MKLWLDDLRPAPAGFEWVKTHDEAIEKLATGQVKFISFDHDLGENKSGYDVACLIERWCEEKRITCPEWEIHSDNPVGQGRINAAMASARRFWWCE